MAKLNKRQDAAFRYELAARLIERIPETEKDSSDAQTVADLKSKAEKKRKKEKPDNSNPKGGKHE